MFDDVEQDSWFEPAVTWLVNSGITKGCAERLFCPSADVTRRQFVTFLWRAAGEPAARAPGSEVFADVAAGGYADRAIGWAVETGVTVGCGSNPLDAPERRFCPARPITRAQLAAMLYRYVGSAQTGSTPFTDVTPGSYYADAVGWMHRHRITLGCDTSAFCPGRHASRAQAAAFIYRAATSPESWPGDSNPFPGVPASVVDAVAPTSTIG